MFKQPVFLSLYLFAGIVLGSLNSAIAEEKKVEICSLVTQDQLDSIYRKPSHSRFEPIPMEQNAQPT
jgi:hypothetical protein